MIVFLTEITLIKIMKHCGIFICQDLFDPEETHSWSRALS